jgi:SAM-dependent methyltransferase
MPDSTTSTDTPTALPMLHWMEADQPCSALWHSERGSAPPTKVVLADDTTNADTAYRLACEGTALLWRGDFHNARQMLQALTRRLDRLPDRQKVKAGKQSSRLAKQAALAPDTTTLPAGAPTPAQAFHQHRMAQAQRARILAMVLVPFDADYRIPLRRAPDVREACSQVWGAPSADTPASVASLRELMGMTSTQEWRKVGVEVLALGEPPGNRIYPHYGVFSPVRGEYAHLVAKAPLPVHAAPKATMKVFDIGTGTGVLAAVLARRGLVHITGTDQDPRALACARENIERLGHAEQVTLLQADLFPPGKAHLIVCNPPWLPARPSAPVEYAVYDEDSRMLLGFLNGLKEHLMPGGEAWLVLSDIAEHLGLRSREELHAAFETAGLRIVARLETKPFHPKTADATDPLHVARAAEITSLWRLAAA